MCNNATHAAEASMKIFGRSSDEPADRNRTKTNGYIAAPTLLLFAAATTDERVINEIQLRTKEP